MGTSVCALFLALIALCVVWGFPESTSANIVRFEDAAEVIRGSTSEAVPTP